MTSLLDLPEELLSRICEFATRFSSGTGVSLLRTNKQLYRIASAVCYRHLGFSSPATGPEIGVDRCARRYANTRFERYLRATITEDRILMQLRSLRLSGTHFRQNGPKNPDWISQLASASQEGVTNSSLAEYRARTRKKKSLSKPVVLNGEGQALCIAVFRLAKNLTSLYLDSPSFQDLASFAHLAEADLLQKSPKLKRLVLLELFIPQKWHLNEFWKYILEIESLEELAIAKINHYTYSPRWSWPGASPSISPNTRLSNLRVLRLGGLFKDAFHRGPNWILPSCHNLDELSLEFIGGWTFCIENFSFLIDTIYVAQKCCHGLKTFRLLDDLTLGPLDYARECVYRSPFALTDARTQERLHAQLFDRSQQRLVTIQDFTTLRQLQISAHMLLFFCIFVEPTSSIPADTAARKNCFGILPTSLETIKITECSPVTVLLLSHAIEAQLDCGEFPPLHSIEATIRTDEVGCDGLRSEEQQCWTSFRRLRKRDIDFRLMAQQGRSQLDFWD